MALSIIVLAAGKGTRMRSEWPKVLAPLAGRPLLEHVLDGARELSPASLAVVIGHGADSVRQGCSGDAPGWVEQQQQLGTGHAVQQALPGVPDEHTVLVLYGDVPLVSSATLKALAEVAQSQSCLTLLTTRLADPAGYGRIMRDQHGAIQAIVEERDATEAQRAITEINTGLMAAPAGKLRRWLEAVSNNNAQGEYYLTDVVALAVADGETVAGVEAEPSEVAGVNDRAQLAQLERRYQLKQAEAVMAAGVTVLDPARLDIRGRCSAGADSVLDVNVVLEGDISLGRRVRIGAHCHLRDCELGDDVQVLPFSHLEGVKVASGVTIGPYARLRPGTELAEGARVGNFVEIKNSRIGANSKINHLSYIGDTTMGNGVNIGAGTITCNYDGVNKHPTQIGDDVFVGSDSQLVAPVKIGDGATIGAGSTITRNAPPGQLSLTRVRQQSVSGWRRPRKGDKN